MGFEKKKSMEIKTAPEYKTIDEILTLWKYFREDVKICLNKTPDSVFTTVPEPGRWSISEVGEHLYLTQWNIARTAPIILGKKFGSDTDEQANLDYEKMLKYFFKPTGVKNPESVAPLSKYGKQELFDLLDKAEKKLDTVLKGKEKADLQKRGLEHPYFGLLNLFNFIWVMALHENSHLVALKERTAQYSR